MRILGIDPGLTMMAAVLLDENGGITLHVSEGIKTIPVSKKNPHPANKSLFYRTTFIAASVTAFFQEINPEIIAMEGASFGSRRQDSLEGVRQAVYDYVVQRKGLSGAEASWISVSPQQGKKALAGMHDADKARMVDSARSVLKRSDPAASREFDRLGSKRAAISSRQVAIADALGIAVCARNLLSQGVVKR